MPVVKALCYSCGHVFQEDIQADGEVEDCPRCGSSHVDEAVPVPATEADEAGHDVAAGGCGGCNCADPGQCGGSCGQC